MDTAITQIAAKIADTRTLVGDPSTRCETIACLGGAALDNEERYLLSKLMRALGLVYIEHQARI